jgi:hypothetical protein
LRTVTLPGGGAARDTPPPPGVRNGCGVLVNVHLPTVRYGVEKALGTNVRDLGPVRAAVEARARAARIVRARAGDPAPNLILAGDFNTPADGRIYQESWSAFRNAFTEAGTGWGLTKQTRWFGARIDHILYAPPWTCRSAWIGPPRGSDHRPLVADLVLEQN